MKQPFWKQRKHTQSKTFLRNAFAPLWQFEQLAHGPHRSPEKPIQIKKKTTKFEQCYDYIRLLIGRGKKLSPFWGKNGPYV